MFVLAALAAAVTVALTGAIAGLFYGFSVAVMPAFDKIKAEHAIVGMQSINVKIVNPVFLTSFMGAPVAAAVTGALLLTLGQGPAAALCFIAAAVYVAGTFVPTMIVNQPMNLALGAESVPAADDQAARLWSDYSTRWTWWNSLRTVFSTISLLLVGAAVFVWGWQA